MSKKVIAVDIGASSGKMAFGEFDGSQLLIREYRDFVNRPVEIGTALYWDVFSLHNAIIDGMAYFKEKYGEADTVAIDTWGASYGLLDKKGRLMEPVYHYRDERTRTTIQDMNDVMDTYELFQLTGCQCNRTYTLPQLYSYRTEGSAVLDNADSMLLLPDLLGYFLTGAKTTEMTIAGTLYGNRGARNVQRNSETGNSDSDRNEKHQTGGYSRSRQCRSSSCHPGFW